MAEDLVVTRRVSIPADELSWTAVRSGGPGGQNVNKVATKVELRFRLSVTRVLSLATRERLAHLARGRLDADGNVLIVCQDTRNQAHNLEIARARLAALVRAALVVPKPRRATKKTAASERRRLDTKRHRAETKRTRRGVDSE